VPAVRPMSRFAAALALLSPHIISFGACCADWCNRDAYGQSHCAHAECLACEYCANRVSCTPTKKEDLSHKSCERWCKPEHAGSHCVACACQACAFCNGGSPTVSAVPASTGLASNYSTSDSSVQETVSSPQVQAVEALTKLAEILAKRGMKWNDAFLPFDRSRNGKISSSELQRVFHSNNVPPLPLHGLPSTVTSLRGIDYGALAAMLPVAATAGEAPPSSASPTASSVLANLQALARALAEKGLPWDDAFKPFDRGNGLVGASELHAIFSNNHVSPPPLHELPAAVTTLHGVDYRALGAMVMCGDGVSGVAFLCDAK